MRDLHIILFGYSGFLKFIFLYYCSRLRFLMIFKHFRVILRFSGFNLRLLQVLASRILNFGNLWSWVVLSFTFAGRSFHDFDLALIIWCFDVVLDGLLDSTFVITFLFAAISRNHFPLHLGSFFFHSLELISILVLLPFQLVFYFYFLVDLLVLIELSIAKTPVRLFFCSLVLQAEKRMVILAFIILKLGQSRPLLLNLVLDIFEPSHGFRICKIVLTIDVCCNPFLMMRVNGRVLNICRMSLHRRAGVVDVWVGFKWILWFDSWVNRHCLHLSINFINALLLPQYSNQH